jgi:hypothetical protein
MRNTECDKFRVIENVKREKNKTAEPVKVRIAFSPLLYAPLRYPRRSKTHQQVVRVLQLRIMYLTSARSIEPTCPSHYHIYRSVTRNITRSIESACEVGHRRSVCLVTVRGIHHNEGQIRFVICGSSSVIIVVTPVNQHLRASAC